MRSRRGWDVVPVIVQDPGLGAIVPGRLGRHAAAPRSRRPHVLARPPRPQGGARPPRAQRAARRRGSTTCCAGSSSTRWPITSSDRHAVHAAFLAWAEGRRAKVARRAGERGRRAEVGGRGRGYAGRPACSRSGSIAGRGARGGARRLPRGPAAAPTARLLDGPITVKRALSTSATLFGDPVEAEVDVYTRDRSIAPRVGQRGDRASGRTGSRRRGSTREHEGDISLLRTRITLECLTRTCLPPRGGVRVVRFRPFAVTYRRGGEGVTGARALGAPPGLLAAPAGRRGRRRARSTPRRRSSRGSTGRRRGYGRCCSSSPSCSDSRAPRSSLTTLWPSSYAGAASLATVVSARALAAARGGGRERRRDHTPAHARRSGSSAGRRPGTGARAADAGARLGREPTRARGARSPRGAGASCAERRGASLMVELRAHARRSGTSLRAGVDPERRRACARALGPQDPRRPRRPRAPAHSRSRSHSSRRPNRSAATPAVARAAAMG